MPLPAAGRKASIAANTTVTPSSAERRRMARPSARAPSPNTIAHSASTERKASRGNSGTDAPSAAKLRVVTSRIATTRRDTPSRPDQRAAAVAAATAKTTAIGASRARGLTARGAAVMVSSHTRATRSARAGKAGSA